MKYETRTLLKLERTTFNMFSWFDSSIYQVHLGRLSHGVALLSGGLCTVLLTRFWNQWKVQGVCEKCKMRTLLKISCSTFSSVWLLVLISILCGLIGLSKIGKGNQLKVIEIVAHRSNTKDERRSQVRLRRTSISEQAEEWCVQGNDNYLPRNGSQRSNAVIQRPVVEQYVCPYSFHHLHYSNRLSCALRRRE